MMIAKIKTLKWYLDQPKGLQLVLNLLKRKTIYRRLENTRREATSWCSDQAMETKDALKKIFGKQDVLYDDPSEVFPGEFQFAKEKYETTPYQMGGRGNITLLYSICEELTAKYVLETGVAYGWSSLSVLLSLNKRKDCLLVSTDMPYAKMGNEDYVGIVVPHHLKDHWYLIKESDISGLPKALKKVPYLDLVHYDSDKSYLGRMSTYPKLYNKLREGGVFISDDINDNLAFMHFCEKQNKQPIVISFEDKYVGVLMK